MFIPNPETVKSGVDIVRLEFPDDYSDFYYLARTALKKHRVGLLTYSTYPQPYSTDGYDTQSFILSILEGFLEIHPKTKYLSSSNPDNLVGRVYNQFLKALPQLEVSEILERFKAALKSSTDRLGEFMYSRKGIVKDILSQIAIFEIVEPGIVDSINLENDEQ